MKQLVDKEIKAGLVLTIIFSFTVLSQAVPLTGRTKTGHGILNNSTKEVLKDLKIYAQELHQLARNITNQHSHNIDDQLVLNVLRETVVFINISQMAASESELMSRENLTEVLKSHYILLNTNQAYLAKILELSNDDISSILKYRTNKLRNKVLFMLNKVRSAMNGVSMDIPEVELNHLFLDIRPSSRSFRSDLNNAAYRVFLDCVKLSAFLVSEYTTLLN